MRAITCASAALFAAIATTAKAAAVSASVTVSATVVSSCSMAGGAIAFGAYAPGASAERQGAITVNCSPGTAYSVALDAGQAADPALRNMSGPDGARFAYNLRREATRNARWRAGANTASGVGDGTSQAIPVHAAPLQAEGGYYDTVTATLIY